MPRSNAATAASACPRILGLPQAAPGSFHFGTQAPERMTIISGELAVKPDGGEWARYPAGTAFEIGGRSGFDVRATEPCAYLCEFL